MEESTRKECSRKELLSNDQETKERQNRNNYLACSTNSLLEKTNTGGPVPKRKE